LKFEFFKKEEIVIKYGEAGLKFYFLLKGAADIIVSKWQTVYLTEEKYMEYLMKLIIYGENVFLQKTLIKNNKYLHLNKKAINEFVFEQVKKIKSVENFENLDEETQRFFKEFVLNKPNYGFSNSKCHLILNKTINFSKNLFNFEKEDAEFYQEKDVNNNHINNKKSEDNQLNFIRKDNNENPEKNNFVNYKKNKIKKVFSNLDIKINENVLTKNTNNSLEVSPKQNQILDLKTSFLKHGSGQSENNMIKLTRLDNERQKSILHFKEILKMHSKATASDENKKLPNESYFFSPKSEKITTKDYINRIKPNEANASTDRNNNINYKNNNSLFLSDGSKKEFKILLYYHVKSIKSGDVFGQMALLENEGKRNATLIATEDCYLGVLDKQAYNSTLQEHDSKKLNEDINLFVQGPIFSNYPKMHFFKNVLNLFEFRKIDKGSFIGREGQLSDNIVFIKEGVYEIRVKCSIRVLEKLIKLLGGQAKSLPDEEDYLQGIFIKYLLVFIN